MRLLKGSQIPRIILLLVGLVLVGGFTLMVFTEDNSTEKDEIVARLKKNTTRKEEVARIKQIRRTQINALLQILIDYQQEIINKRMRDARPLYATIELLGDLRATEAVDPIIRVIYCEFIKGEQVEGSIDWIFVRDRILTTAENTLTKIGNPAVASLINVLKVEKVTSGKSKFARKTLYMIEGNCAIHRLESAYKAETDKKKKARLKEAITKFQSEFKIIEKRK